MILCVVLYFQAFGIISNKLSLMDDNQFHKLIVALPPPNSLYAPRDCIQFIFGDDVTIIHRDNVFFVGNFTEDENQHIQGSGLVYYPSGFVIEGSILNGLPHGDVMISCPSCNVTEKSFYDNGCRQSSLNKPSVISFGAGYQAYACVHDLSPIALESTVPYLRNFYHHSYFDFGRPKLEWIAHQNGDFQKPLPNDSSVLWSVQNFDIQQSQMVVDLSSTALTELNLHSNHPFFREESNNLLREVTLVCHSLVRKHQLNFMIPEIARFRRINQIVKDSVNSIRNDGLDQNEKTCYTNNWESVFAVLAFSNQLTKLSLVAYPFAKLVMTVDSSVWSRIAVWELKRMSFDLFFYF